MRGKSAAALSAAVLAASLIPIGAAAAVTAGSSADAASQAARFAAVPLEEPVPVDPAPEVSPTPEPEPAPTTQPVPSSEPNQSPPPSATTSPDKSAAADEFTEWLDDSEHPSDDAADAPEQAAASEAARAAADARVAQERARLLALAQEQLGTAEKGLGQAQRTQRLAAKQLKEARAEVARFTTMEKERRQEAVQARRDLGNLARLAYTAGPTDFAAIVSIVDSDRPLSDLNHAAVATSVAEHQHSQWRTAVALHEYAVLKLANAEEELGEARKEIKRQNIRVDEARLQVEIAALAVQAGGMASAEGAAQIATLCADHDIPQCYPTGWGEANLTRDSVWIMREVGVQWPAIAVVGGWRPSDPYPDHPTGRAVDVMMPAGGRGIGDVVLGDEIAMYFMENAEDYGIEYIIWRQRIWRFGGDAETAIDGWRLMGDRGSPTANHLDHVHITVSTGASGTAVHMAIEDAAAGVHESQQDADDS